MSTLDDLAQVLQAVLREVGATLSGASSAHDAVDGALTAAQQLGRFSEIAAAERLQSEVAEAQSLLSAARERFAEALQRVAALQAGTEGTSGTAGPEAAVVVAAASASGWHSPGVADHPQRPDPASIHLTEERRSHILDGDPDRPESGGHRYGTGRAGKTEFPARWDDDTTAGHAVSVARDPDKDPLLQDNGKWQVRGHRDDVEVVVIVKPNGAIVTSHPEPGGRGVVRNPLPRSNDGR